MYRLLIVDDEAGHREGMIGLLRMLKPEYLVFEAESGERALQIMGTMNVDLVLTGYTHVGHGWPDIFTAGQGQATARALCDSERLWYV